MQNIRGLTRNEKIAERAIFSFVMRAAGVEPALTAWKAAVIPLDHARERPLNHRIARNLSSASHLRIVR